LHLSDERLAEQRAAALDLLGSFHVARIDGVVLDRASEPFPTLLRTLDAIHLATAILLRPQYQDLVFATHDTELATAARAVGFRVIGAAVSKG
jgi:predicted nucleic acid-binding protein